MTQLPNEHFSIDYKCDIFQTTYRGEGRLFLRKGRMWNKITNTWPSVVHYPGSGHWLHYNWTLMIQDSLFRQHFRYMYPGQFQYLHQAEPATITWTKSFILAHQTSETSRRIISIVRCFVWLCLATVCIFVGAIAFFFLRKFGIIPRRFRTERKRQT